MGAVGKGSGVADQGAQAKEAGTIARKAAAGRARRPEPVPITPERALTLALARVADRQMDLPLRVGQLDARPLSLAEIPETLMEQPLIAMLEGPGEGLGVIALCPTLVASLIEVQTVGRLSHRPVQPRRPTRTDAAMAALFLDAVLEAFETLLLDLPGQGWAVGYRYASYLDDPRPLGLMLEDCAYRGFSLEISLGADGQRSGRMLVALPAVAQPELETPEAPLSPARQAAAAQSAQEAQLWTQQLEQTVMASELRLTAVLDRLYLPLSEMMNWRPGDLVELHEDVLAAIALEAAGGAGQAVLHGRLGQNRGARALRLNGAGGEPASVSPEARDPLGALMAERGDEGAAQVEDAQEAAPIQEDVAQIGEALEDAGDVPEIPMKIGAVG